MFGLLIATTILVPAALILAGHWFPWPSVLGRRLARLEAYVFGVGVIFVMPLSLFAYAADKTELALLFIASCISAGAAASIAKGIDVMVERYHKLQDARDAAEHADR